MTGSKPIVLSSDHAAIELRQAVASHVTSQDREVVDIGLKTPENTDYPVHGQAAAQAVISGECRLGIILWVTGQGIMMAANKVPGIRCGVCSDTFSARMIRALNDANMLSIARVSLARVGAFPCSTSILCYSICACRRTPISLEKTPQDQLSPHSRDKMK